MVTIFGERFADCAITQNSRQAPNEEVTEGCNLQTIDCGH